MWNELFACTANVYAWEVKTGTTHQADFAVSLTEYVETLPKNSKSRRILFASDDVDDGDANSL
jgi:hypothetical protein